MENEDFPIKTKKQKQKKTRVKKMSRPLKDELAVLSCLRQNSRQALKDLSRKTRIPISTIYEKIKKNSNNLVKKYTTLIDFNKLGYTTRANIAIRVDPKDKDALSEHLQKSFNVNSLYRINNGYDYLVEVVFRHIKEMEDFLEHMDANYKIKEKKVFYIIDEIEKEAFMTAPEHIDMLIN